MRFEIDHLTTSCLPNTCMILHMIAKLKIFVTFFSGTTIQGFLKFCFRIYISQLYCVMRFQIHHSTTSCLPNTCIFLHYLYYPLAAGVSSVNSSSQFHLFFFTRHPAESVLVPDYKATVNRITCHPHWTQYSDLQTH